MTKTLHRVASLANIWDDPSVLLSWLDQESPMSLLDVFAKLFRNPMEGISLLMDAPMTMEAAMGWLIVVFAGMITLGLFVWILMKLTGR